jgi:hypothetical protein
MRPVRILLPLRRGRIQTSFLSTLGDELAHRPAPVVSNIIATLTLTTPRLAVGKLLLLPHFRSESLGGVFVNTEVRIDYDAIIALCAIEGDEPAVHFLCDNGSGPREGVAEAAAAPGYPFEDVACEVLVNSSGEKKMGKERVTYQDKHVDNPSCCELAAYAGSEWVCHNYCFCR